MNGDISSDNKSENIEDMNGNNNNVNNNQNNIENYEVKLMENGHCNAKLFQKLWKNIKNKENIQGKAKSVDAANLIESYCHDKHFKTTACGTVKNILKLYLYGQEYNNDIHLIECIINLNTLQYNATIKGQNNNYIKIAKYFQIIIRDLIQ